MRTILIWAVALILIASPTIGTEKSRPHDGHYWRENDDLGEVGVWFKGGYLSGHNHAYVTLVNELYAIATFASSAQSPCAEALMTIWESWSDYYSIEGATYGQVMDGLDEFYRDWRNRQIDVSDALHIVKSEIRGGSVTDVDKAKRLLRLPKEKVWEMLLSDTVSQADKGILLRNAIKGK